MSVCTAMKIFVFLCFLLLVASCHASPRITVEREGWQWSSDYQRSTNPTREDEIVHLTVMLRHRSPRAFEDRVLGLYRPGSPTFGRYLSLAEVREAVALDSGDISMVLNWVRSVDVVSVEVVATGDMIEVSLRVSEAARLLETKFMKFIHRETREVIHRARSYSLPEDVAKHVAFVGGVTHFPRLFRIIERSSQSNDLTTPQVLKERYGVPSTPAKTSNVHAIGSFLGQYVSKSDLKMFQDKMSLLNDEIAKIIGPNDESKPGVEASLDIQYLMGMGEGISTWIWSVDGERQGQEPFLQWLYDVSNASVVPMLFSVSYGDFEDTLDAPYMRRVDAEFQKAAARGLTIIFASGDSGAGCDLSCDRFRPTFPASSPWVTSVGATDPSFEDHKISDEAGVSWSTGGFSTVFEQPTYQKDWVNQYLAKQPTPTSYFNTTTRGFPDVGAVGVNFEIVVYGNVRTVGGTSASCPTFAGITSRLNAIRTDAGLKPLGFANPFLYWARSTDDGSFFDITEGNNKAGCCAYGFDCLKGWDAVVGLGTPQFEKLKELVVKYQ